MNDKDDFGKSMKTGAIIGAAAELFGVGDLVSSVCIRTVIAIVLFAIGLPWALIGYFVLLHVLHYLSCKYSKYQKEIDSIEYKNKYDASYNKKQRMQKNINELKDSSKKGFFESLVITIPIEIVVVAIAFWFSQFVSLWD